MTELPEISARDVTRLERIRVAVAQQVSPEVARTVQLDEHEDFLTRSLILKLVATLYAETLPPTHVEHVVAYEHPAAHAAGHTDDPRHATWFDMWKDAMKGRWWARLLGGRRWTVRYIPTPVRYVHREPVQCEHRVTVDIQDRWTYPAATMVLPAEQWGRVVLKSDTSARSKPWLREDGDLPW